jgi:hypothetical protein
MSVPGLLQPTVSAMGGPTPQAAAAAEGAAANQKLALMNSKLAGGKKNGGKKKWRGGNIAVPQFQMSYTPQNGPNQDPNTQIKDLSAISTQASANAVYDSQATKMGGRRRKKGGNPNWNWGCYSGGKRSIRRTRRKSRTKKYKKSRKSRKSRR